MKVGGEKIARCAICGGWPKAVVTMDAHASAHCECMRCGRRGPTITAGVNEFDAPTLARAAAQAWNLPLNLDPELLVDYVDKELPPAQMAGRRRRLWAAVPAASSGHRC